MTGTLYGLGVGPGDPELMTLKAVRLLGQVPVIAYPAAGDGDSSARAIAAGFIPPGATEIAIKVPMRPGRIPVEIYDAAAERIADHLAAGRDVAVLCEGDPLFYGSFMYLHDRLASRFPCLVVPGVSSLTACAASAGQPLAGRNAVLTVLPATLDDADLTARLENTEAAAIIKVGRHLPRLRALIEACGLTARATYVEHASRPDEKVLPLANIGNAEAPYFSMILIAPDRHAEQDQARAT
jgi:precorrin-2/cobalt-factor-2 C20-methyltransferase